MVQVLVLMSSPRKNGNTDRLADAFIKGVEENGYTTEKVYVNYQNINLVYAVMSVKKQNNVYKKMTCKQSIQRC